LEWVYTYVQNGKVSFPPFSFWAKKNIYICEIYMEFAGFFYCLVFLFLVYKSESLRTLNNLLLIVFFSLSTE
jgi:hypothetical protein